MPVEGGKSNLSRIFRKLFFYVAAIVICFFCASDLADSAWAESAKAGSKAKMTPLQMVQTGRYAEALPYFKDMVAKNPREPSFNYYLGLCAESVHDYDLAESAFCRVVVGTPAKSPFVPLSTRQLYSLPHKLQPQCAIFKDQIHRWDRSAMPLRVFVSDGRTLPEPIAGHSADPAKYKEIVATAQTNMASMPVSPLYKSHFSQLIGDGIRAWDWAVKDKLFSYVFVTNPRLADIIVLFSVSERGFTQFPYEKGQPEIVWLSLLKKETLDQHYYENWIRVETAHEFGHCLGLCHSTAAEDLMLPDSPVNAIDERQGPDTLASPNDKASLRALLSMPADLIFYPVK